MYLKEVYEDNIVDSWIPDRQSYKEKGTAEENREKERTRLGTVSFPLIYF